MSSQPLLLANASFAAPLKVLILSGANNHDWHKTTPVLEKILKDSGRFSVDVETKADLHHERNYDN